MAETEKLYKEFDSMTHNERKRLSKYQLKQLLIMIKIAKTSKTRKFNNDIKKLKEFEKKINENLKLI